MSMSEPPVPSFGRLAHAALAHPDWPADTRPQPRSLATLFSKLDREQDLDWLADRVEVQRILAELLNRPVADLQQALPVRSPESSKRLVRLQDLRYGRELDLTKEGLCPGIPHRVLEPATWDRLIWHAPSGSGRSLVGAWLEARGLATHVVLSGSPTGTESFPARGPLFVELTDSEETVFSSDSWTAWSQRLAPERRPVCVALAIPPPSTEWELLESPPLASILPDLIDWVADRLPGDGHFEPERALGWMQRVALPSRAVTTLGDALGLLGMLDEVRPRTLHGRSLDEIAESFLRQRLAQSSQETTVSSWLNRNAFAALLGSIAQLIIESDRPWNSPRTFDEWLALVPEEYRDGIDVEWMRAALSRNTPHRVRANELASAARSLPPGGYQLLRALEHARILVRSGDRLRLAPHWFGTTLQARATHHLIGTSAYAWGEALLRPVHAPRVMQALTDRVLRSDFTPIHAALELAEPENPAYVAAIEAAVTTIGIAAASGLTIPSDLARDLFAEQDRLSLPFPDEAPRPRIAHPPEAAHHEPLLRPAAWLLGVYALADSIGPSRFSSSPFRHHDSSAQRARLRDQIYPKFLELLRACEEQQNNAPSPSERSIQIKYGSTVARYPWAITIYSLVDSLRAYLGPVAETPTDLELPAHAAERLERNQWNSDLLERLAQLPYGIAAFVDRAGARNLSWAVICRRLWDAWDVVRPFPDAFDPRRSGDPLVTEFWREIPPEVLRRLYRANQPIAWSALLPHHHAALFGAQASLPEEAARLAPLDPLLDALDKQGPGLLSSPARIALWRRSTRRVLALFERWLDARRLAETRVLLESVPDELTALATDAVGTRLDVTTLALPDLHPLRGWLAERIARRVPDWEKAYELLHRIENVLHPLRRHLFDGTP